LPGRSLDPFFNARSIAIVGASADPNKTGGRPLLYLTQHGFKGDIFLVNPMRAEISGRISYPSLAAIGRSVDLALIMNSAEQVEGAIRDGLASGIKNYIVYASGFAEVNE